MKEITKLGRIKKLGPIVMGTLALLLLTLGALAGPVAQVTQDWVATYPGLYGVAVVIDGSGNSYVTGTSLQDAAHNYKEDIILIKYDAQGDLVWAREFDETDDATFGSDTASWLTLDPAGNVIVGGSSFLNGSGFRTLILKYDANGNLLWKTRSTIGVGARRVATDATGNIYALGPSTNTNSVDYVTYKFAPNGVQLWAKTYNGPSNFRDEPNSLAVTPGGTVAVTGRSSSGSYDVATILYDTNGNALWVRRFDGANDGDAGNDVAFGPGGEVYVGGYTVLSALTDMLLLKYDAAGNLVWTKTHNGADNQSDSIARIRVDSQGNVVATGYIQAASFYSDFGTLKYAPNGNLLWLRLYDGPIANDEEIPRALAIGPNDSVYVTGYQQGQVSVATVKYDANGNQAWAETYDHPNTLLETGYAIAVDAAGNATITGSSPILTIRYGESGAPNPTATATVAATATALATATATSAPPPTATPPPPTGCTNKCLRAKQIQLSRTAAGVMGKVTVRDEKGALVKNATVSIAWTLPSGATQNQAATTNAKGVATFNVTGGAGVYTLTVANITKVGYTFDPANSLLSKNFTR